MISDFAIANAKWEIILNLWPIKLFVLPYGRKMNKKRQMNVICKDIVSTVPPFTPSFLLPAMICVEKLVDRIPFFKVINSTNALGFKLKNKKQ